MNMPRNAKQAKRPVGRPKTGKRSNDDYQQGSIWLPRSLRADVLRALVRDDGSRYEFSGLVESLLRRWLDAGAKLPKD